MENDDIIDGLENMSGEELREVRRELMRIGKERPYMPPGVRCLGYVPGTWAENLKIAVDIAYENGYIHKNTVYAFTTEAVKAYINGVIRKKIASKGNLDL